MMRLGPAAAVLASESLSREPSPYTREGQGGDRRRRPQDDQSFAEVLARLQRR
ncbi:MAG: hypothetical protein FJZ01_28325 [Candidatus Sericytochromatia bacterium]|nr:hypothetical protein [Candidatus Tanganyikabacteria bacterium]